MRLVGIRQLAGALTACAALAVGCGDEDPASKAFGGLSDADQETLRDFTGELRPFPNESARFLQALRQSDMAAARTAVGEMDGLLERGREISGSFEGDRPRRSVDGYLRALQGAVDSYDGLLRAMAVHGKYAASPEVNEAIEEVRRASATARRADRTLLERIGQGLSAEERRELMSAFEQKLKESPGG